MKCLTICQPWAELIARGTKRVENRGWRTGHRGPLLIHAATERKSREWGMTDRDVARWGPYPYGAIVAVVNLVEVIAYQDAPEWLRDHPYASGPVCWILASAFRLPRPIPYRGVPGLYDVPDDILPVAAES